MSTPIKGRCHFYSETGTEGGWWAIMSEVPSGRSPYEGLHVLADGDELQIFDPTDPTKVVWSGAIALTLHPLFTVDVFGWWIHADQRGIDRIAWAEFFFKEYPAEVTPKNRT